LFLVFINNFNSQAALLTIVPKFVDDTKLGHVMRPDQGRQELQTSLDKQ
jgi:hypothetical protein